MNDLSQGAPSRVQPRRVTRFGLDRLERELTELLTTIHAYRSALGEYPPPGIGRPDFIKGPPLESFRGFGDLAGLGEARQASPDAAALDEAHDEASDDGSAQSPFLSNPSARAGATQVDLGSSMADGPLGDTGWVLQGGGWLLKAPDGHRLRINICERALVLALRQSPEHALSFDAYFELIKTTRAVYSQKPLRQTSMRMILMRLMKKLGQSNAPCPLVSMHGWGYRLRTKQEVELAANSAVDRHLSRATNQVALSRG